jgi:hypothetical protein
MGYQFINVRKHQVFHDSFLSVLKKSGFISL